MLGERYPDDAGVLAALLLNRVVLEPGQALYLAAGNLHAYVSGAAVEVMANSDNVLRGGLTPKHVDVPELLRVLDFTPRTVGSGADDILGGPGGGLRDPRARVPGLAGAARRDCAQARGVGGAGRARPAATGGHRGHGVSAEFGARCGPGDRRSGGQRPVDGRIGSGVVVSAHSPAAEFFRTLVGGH
ncbi:hypothetical protein MTP03_12380 [Tsukamurella sp. PLM1]|nr:hypothetical protein MTP03_12380 [Tsukamurella sp. PLM1]